MKLKSYLFTIAIVFGFFSHSIHAQTGKYGEWTEIDYSTNNSYYSLCENLPNGDLLRVKKYNEIDYVSYENIIDKLDRNGKVLKSISIDLDSINLYFIKARRISSENYTILFGYADTYLVLGFITDDLDILSIKVIDIHNKLPFVDLDPLILENGNIMVVGSTNLFNLSNDIPNMFFMLLDSKGELLNQKVVDVIFPERHCFSLEEEIDSDEVICLGADVYKLSNDVSKVTKLGDDKIGISPGNQVKIRKWNDEKYLVAASGGLSQPDPFNFDSFICFVDRNLEGIRYNGFNLPFEDGYAIPRNPFDYYDRNKIYFGFQDDLFSGISDMGFHLMQLDSTLHQVWQISMKGNDISVQIRNITATSDGGILVFGYKVVPKGSILNRYPLMIKINSDGVLADSQDPDISDFTFIKVFPNPTSGALNLQLSGLTANADIRIFDSNGRNVFVFPNAQNGENTLDITHLPSGTYIYKVYQGNKNLGSGKIVKVD
ncbi:MAG: T9SS type A sorting domain-containing protein [Lewinellaceae bacterium]|nr:T9SS type A sorting domain-containing protein [Lewinellaceae bacterium]